MKKNKNSQLLLLILVLVIWGTIAVKLVGLSNSNSTFVASSHDILDISIAPTDQKDTFNLMLNYRDPFKSFGIISKNTSTQKTSHTKPKIPIHNPKNITKPKMPAIEYLGFATDHQMNQKVRITIDQQPLTLSREEKTHPLLLEMVHKDSILINWEGIKRVIYRRKRDGGEE